MERRSKDLGISIPDYLKYIVVKENEEIELLRSKAIKK
jgi:hypothetical protein